MQFVYDGPIGAKQCFLFAHGAGAPMDSPFMAEIAAQVGAAGIRVCRFEFPYMAARRKDGKKRGPDRATVLLDCYRQAIAAQRQKAESGTGEAQLFIGGKSMGGRYASLVCDEQEVAGLICLGYPFHPPGKPEKTRTDHLRDLRTPSLILQGTRDSLGNREDVAGYTLSKAIELHWLEDGDHSFKPRKRSGRTEAQAWREAAEAIIAFIERHAG